MTVFKCKMCGGALEVSDGMSVAQCEYCGTKQTLPKLDDERKTNMYDRANHFRRNNDFDKAMSIYEQILNEDKTDAEAYWSIVLCRYGIEYVEDPISRKRVPTVNRAQYTSVFMDEDYRAAIQYADPYQRIVYEQEAKVIDEIQKGILEISQKEEPFDVFICYKETGADGRRTPDSVLAAELYHELTDEGFKVFFSRITLENKLGTAYEPYIFAALNSAKVMVVLGTKSEYFNAVWVRNEWSRYLALIKNGQKKVLIPAFKDMDPYDLPEEFSHLQAQDMSKLGFMQDLIHGIRKLADTDKNEKVKETVVTQTISGVNTAPLLRRVFMFLEDGDWESADEYCEKVLDAEPENARAYLGKLMAEVKAYKPEDLEKCEIPHSDRGNFKKAVRFADSELAATLKKYNQTIIDRNEQKRLKGIYEHAERLMKKAADEEDFMSAADIFGQIPEYLDAAELRKQCIETSKNMIYSRALSIKENAKSDGDFFAAAVLFKQISGYYDADTLAAECDEKVKECIYNTACEQMKGNTEKGFNSAIEYFKKIPDYRDSQALIELCRKEAVVCRKDSVLYHAQNIAEKGGIEDFTKAIGELKKIPGHRNADELIEEYTQQIKKIKLQEEREEKERIAAEKRRKKCRIILVSVALVLVLALLFFALILPEINRSNYYNALKSLRTSLPMSPIAAGNSNTAAVKNDGTVVAVGENDDGQCDVNNWSDIVAVACGDDHIVGLKSDGTVVAVGDNYYGQCNVDNWSDIVAVSYGFRHTVGLKSDGTVVAVGDNHYGQCNVDNWSNIVAVSYGFRHTVGLKSDGTVVAVGENYAGQCDVDNWSDIVAVSCGDSYTVGLKSDGTVVAIGYNYSGQCDVDNWSDIVAVSCGSSHTVGLKSDGTVVTVGDNSFSQCDVDNWSDIVAVSCGSSHTVGLKSDGTVVTVGDNDYGQCNVSGWTDIKTTK